MTEEQANAWNTLVLKLVALSDSILEVYKEADRARRKGDVDDELRQKLTRICTQCLKMLKNYDRG